MNVLTPFFDALDELLEQVKPVIAVVGDKRGGTGAGILVGDGLVLTNHHVAQHGRSLQVMLEDDKTFDARVVTNDPKVDLALLEIPSNDYKQAVISTETPRQGEMVFALGHPWGQRNVLTGGILSAVSAVKTRQGDIPILRADVQLAPGNSGGPLLNASGEVIGINAMIFGGDQSVAIPASVIRSFLEKARAAMPKSYAPEAVL